MNLTKKTGRIGYLDDLRTMAATAVIMGHVSAEVLAEAAVGSSEWLGSLVYNNMVYWCLNIFLMISGILFLDPDRKVELKQILTRYIPRLVIAFFFWSAMYLPSRMDSVTDVRELLINLCQGHFHQWYLFLLVGLYLAVPVLRQITQDKRGAEYFLLLCGLTGIVIPEILILLDYLKLPLTGVLTQVLVDWFDELRFSLTSSSMFYMVLGWYLHKYEVNKHVRRGIWCLAVAAYPIRVVLSMQEGMLGDLIPYGIGDLLMTVGVFWLGRDVLSARRSEGWLHELIRLISGCSFGIYMVHLLVLNHLGEILEYWGISLTVWAAIPLNVFVVLLISLGISWLLCKVPVFKKYIA